MARLKRYYHPKMIKDLKEVICLTHWKTKLEAIYFIKNPDIDIDFVVDHQSPHYPREAKFSAII